MSAIAGIIATNGNAIDGGGDEIAEMLELMRHRGPDNTVIRTLPDGRGALGANELNLTAERTPCALLNRSPYVLYDGEMYNQTAAGQLDIEYFAEMYQKHGKGCFTLLEADYVCAIVEDDEVILARDQVGSRPLFYGTEDGVLYFATEMKALIEYIRFDIAELPPGHTYSTKDGLKPFAPYVADIPKLGDMKETAQTVRKLVIEAVEKRMKGVNGVALSGGLDSSIVAAIAKQINPNIHLFTVTVDSAPGPDLKNAELMAKFLGLEHHIYRITDEDIASLISEAIWYLESFDEDCISGILSNYYASRLAKEYTDAVLVGEGADELFGGYRMVLKSPNVKSDEHRVQLAQKLLDISYNTALRRLDRGWMANGVIYETPFLDAKVVAYSQIIPMDWKIYGEKQTEKFILREAFRDMLPEQIANREKLRFAMGTGMDDVMDAVCTNVVNPEELKARPNAAYGLPFATFKEIYYYDEFLRLFPPAYEKQTIRWDPFK